MSESTPEMLGYRVMLAAAPHRADSAVGVSNATQDQLASKQPTAKTGLTFEAWREAQWSRGTDPTPKEAWEASAAQRSAVVAQSDERYNFYAGVCVSLACVLSQDSGVLWREIVRAVGEDDLLQYAAHIEPEEWELAGFARYAKPELGRRKPRARALMVAEQPTQVDEPLSEQQIEHRKPLTRESIARTRGAEQPIEAAIRGASIKESHHHGAGAYARCSYCGRYSDNPKSLSRESFPCDCGKLHGWSGSFVKPTVESKWSEATVMPANAKGST